MQVTKNLAELCALLVDHVYGELPSRIFAALLNKGRSSIRQLTSYTALTRRQVYNGIIVLLQNNLLFHHDDSGTTIYTASPEGAYNLIRIGKILGMVASVYGDEEQEVLQNIFQMGLTKVEELREAYQTKFQQASKERRTKGPELNGHADEDDDFDTDSGNTKSDKVQPDSVTGLFVKSLEQLDAVLCRLIVAELVVAVNEASFRSAEDTFNAIEDDIKATYFRDGVRGAKGKAEYAVKLAQRLRDVRDEPLKLKRKVQQSIGLNKRRKLMNGNSVNGEGGPSGGLVLDANTVLRINFEKCAVELRNQQLTQYVSELIGDTTAEVYATVLRLLGKKIPRCRCDPLVDSNDDDDVDGPVRVTTNEVFDSLDPSLDVYTGIGKVAARKTDRKSANRVFEHPPHKTIMPDEAEVDGDASSDEDEGEDMNGDFGGDDDYGRQNGANGSTSADGTKTVKFEDTGPAKYTRKEQFRQHLLLLCESKYKFLRHCAMEGWTVDFEPLFESLRELELDTVIQRSAGQNGLRLVRILRRVSKMDEKTLPTLALMIKGHVQKLMLQMQMLGFVDMQEVPRDNNRTVSRTMFLYWTDTHRCLDRLLDNTYKTMLRCLQILEVRRQREEEVLRTVSRDDVRGREKEVLQGRWYNKFVRITEIQEKLLAHVMRLDNLVGTLRDF